MMPYWTTQRHRELVTVTNCPRIAGRLYSKPMDDTIMMVEAALLPSTTATATEREESSRAGSGSGCVIERHGDSDGNICLLQIYIRRR